MKLRLLLASLLLTLLAPPLVADDLATCGACHPASTKGLRLSVHQGLLTQPPAGGSQPHSVTPFTFTMILFQVVFWVWVPYE